MKISHIKIKKVFHLATAIILIYACNVSAAYIEISNLSVIPGEPGSDVSYVQFDMNWDNSWKLTGTEDAAWIFVKYREKGTEGPWLHLNLLPDGHKTVSGSELYLGKPDETSHYDVVSNPYVGAFLQRDDTTVKLAFLMDETERLVDPGISYDFQVFAIEMVYVPEGSFYLGSGGSEIGHLYRVGTEKGHTNQPYQINGEESIVTGSSGKGNLWGVGGTTGFDAVSPSDPDVIPFSFPKGYSAFYIMKYSITQQQYADFLNSLSDVQAENRYAGNRSHRNEIMFSGNQYETSNPYVANNWMGWEDGVAYAAWAGLRPMTELEFEKAARGTANPVPNEYAWGTIEMWPAVGIVNEGQMHEAASNSEANVAFGTQEKVQGPLRVGGFGNRSRESSGASFYGVMELSGNLWERVVTIGNSEGRAFTGLHGNGSLRGDEARADVAGWPGIDALGSGFRGGNWDYLCCPLTISDRLRAVHTDTDRRNVRGFRAVRTSPVLIKE